MQWRAVHKNGKKRITTRPTQLVLQWRDEQQQQAQKPTGRPGEQVLGIAARQMGWHKIGSVRKWETN